MLCVKSKFGLDFVNSPERLTPLFIGIGEKGEGKFRKATRDKALDMVAESRPIIALEMMKAASNRGAQVIVANPRRIRMVEFSDIWLHQKPSARWLTKPEMVSNL